MKEWNEYVEILEESQSQGAYQAAVERQTNRFKRWAASGPKRYASPYSRPAPTHSDSGLGPLEEAVPMIPEIQDDLNRAIWTVNDQVSPEIANKLIRIAMDFYDSLGLDAPILDVIITGSIANYNWTELSDIDLHILIDYAEVNEDEELVQKYLSQAKTNWNRNHEIIINGHEVEVYVQDVNEPHHSSGVYSILRDEWVVTPIRTEFEVSEDDVRKKKEYFEDAIASVDRLVKQERYEEAYGDADRLATKLRNFRRAGLEALGEFSVENIAFKALRNSEEIAKLYDLRREAYDGIMTLTDDQGNP
jgi:hypothetical protein